MWGNETQRSHFCAAFSTGEYSTFDFLPAASNGRSVTPTRNGYQGFSTARAPTIGSVTIPTSTAMPMMLAVYFIPLSCLLVPGAQPPDALLLFVRIRRRSSNAPSAADRRTFPQVSHIVNSEIGRLYYRK